MCRQTLDPDRVAASGVLEGASCDAAVIDLHDSCPCEENDFGAEANVVYTCSRIGRLWCLFDHDLARGLGPLLLCDGNACYILRLCVSESPVRC